MGYFQRSLNRCKELHTGLPHGTVAYGVVPTELNRAGPCGHSIHRGPEGAVTEMHSSPGHDEDTGEK